MKLVGIAQLSLVLGLCCSCSGGGEVVRRWGDIQERGRAISPLAYAWYARGLHHERGGDARRAERDFRSVIDLDPKSGAAWGALGRVVCRRDRDEARRVFEQGLQRASRTAPVQLEQIKCELQSLTSSSDLPPNSEAKLEALCQRAESIVQDEPFYQEASDFVTHCYKMIGKPSEAIRFERAANLFFGKTTEAASSPPLQRIDEALWANDLALAQHLALDELAPGELSARALAWGKRELAVKQANLVLSASPKDADALVVLAIVKQDPNVPAHPGALSPLAAALFVRHLERTVGKADAKHFRNQAKALLSGSKDPLIRAALSLPQASAQEARPAE